MSSEKLTRILMAKSNFSADEIQSLTEDAGWNWVYANAKPRKERLTQVCFTGFGASDKAALVALASASRLEVVGSITKKLAFLCAGENAGPSKLEVAIAQGVVVLSKTQFEILLETGELPNP